MELVDVLFPQNIGPLTYQVPKDLHALLREGLMVEADVRGRMKRGMVVSLSPDAPQNAKGKLKNIESILYDEPSLSPALLKLILWVSRYYMCREGLTLKALLPAEFFEPVKTRAGTKVREPLVPYEASASIEPAIAEAIKKFKAERKGGGFKTFLHHAASTRGEFAFLLEAIKGMSNVIIVAPDNDTVLHLVPALKAALGERLIEYHSALSRGQRSEAIRRMASGLGDVVIGSHMAAFAPMAEVSMIAVLAEESPLYKAEGAPRHSVRDSALMRAYCEGRTALLSSICPSLEAWHKAQSGDYVLLDTAKGAPRPRVRIVDGKGNVEGKAISPTIERAVRGALEAGKRSLLFINRKGYSILRCTDCGYIERCTDCDIPLVFHKGKGGLRCGYCGEGRRPTDSCPECKGAMSPSGMGLERLEEELKDLSPVGVDRARKDNLALIADEPGSLGVGTKALSRSAALGGSARVAGLLNADSMLMVPDFRSRERAFQEMIYAADMTAPTEGELFVQVRFAGLPMLGWLRRFSFRQFYAEELKERREAGYPPFMRLAVVDLRLKDEPGLPKVKGVEMLGPVPLRLKPRKGRPTTGYRVLMKAPTREALRGAVEKLCAPHEPILVDIDMDPVGV